MTALMGTPCGEQSVVTAPKVVRDLDQAVFFLGHEMSLLWEARCGLIHVGVLGSRPRLTPADAAAEVPPVGTQPPVGGRLKASQTFPEAAALPQLPCDESPVSRRRVSLPCADVVPLPRGCCAPAPLEEGRWGLK